MAAGVGGCRERPGTCRGLGPALEPRSPALALGVQEVLWQVPLRTAVSRVTSTVVSTVHVPSPMGWREQLGTCILQSALVTLLVTCCAQVCLAQVMKTPLRASQVIVLNIEPRV